MKKEKLKSIHIQKERQQAEKAAAEKNNIKDFSRAWEDDRL